MLMEIAREKRSQARRLLHCLAVSIRPLRVEELAELFALDFDGAREGIPKLNKEWRWDDPEQGIVTICSGLIHIGDYFSDTRIVQFAHFSVKQFLTSDRLAILNEDVARFHISLGKAHTVVAQACLGILLSGNGVNDERAESRSPLAEYAARHWIDHARFKNVTFRVEDGMRRLFDPGKPYFTAWLQLHDIDEGWNLFGDNSTQELDGTPLYYASLCGFRDLVDHLIDKHPQCVITRGGRNHGPLVAALHKRYFDIAERLLRHDADVDVRGYESRTPLHAASVGGLADVAKWLLDHSADPNAVQDDLLTPLNLAAANGHLELVQMLLKHGAKINSMTNDRSIPLHQASENGHFEIVRLLIDQGAEINARNGYQSTPLHLASFRGHAEVVRLLIDHKADVKAQNGSQSTPLHLASSGMHETVPLLIDYGEEVNTRDGELTPLRIAPSGVYETALLLIEHGAEVNARDVSQSTPLHLASSAGLVDIVQLLIGYEADVDAENHMGKTPFQVALSARHLDQKITTLLSEYRA
jgi:ankyrin repeat protein